MLASCSVCLTPDQAVQIEPLRGTLCCVLSMHSKGPAKWIQHVDATSSNIVESNMLHSFGHHVARCCMMLDDVERSLISIKHCLQHHPTFLLFLSANKYVAFVWPPCSKLLTTHMPAKLTLWVFVSMAMIHCLITCFVWSTWRYGMVNEESFQSLSKKSTSDLSANRKKRSKAAVENLRTVKLETPTCLKELYSYC